MTELLELLLQHQTQMVERLGAIEAKLAEIADHADEYAPASTASSVVGKLTDIAGALEWTNKTSALGQILGELRWTEKNSTAERLITAMESLEAAIRELHR